MRMTTLTTHGSNERGFALAITLFMMAMLSGLTAAALRMSETDIKVGRNYRAANQGLYAAEAGIKHAVAIINGSGTINVKKEIVDKWPQKQAPFAANPNPMARHATFSYSVTIAADPYSADPNRALLTATGTGADQTVRTVTAHIHKSTVPYAPPGAVHLASGNAVSTSFVNAAFKVDGSDKYYGTPGSQSSIPGISAVNSANATTAQNNLSHSQKAQVTGLGYVDNPRQASVAAVPRPTTSEINSIINNLINQSGSVSVPSSQFKDSKTYGTAAAPQVTRVTGSAFKITGNVTGHGVMIIEPNVEFEGNFEFNGLVIVRGTLDTSTIKSGGSTLINGSLWMTGSSWVMGGSATVQYSSQALQFAQQAAINIGAGGLFPQPVAVVGWRDVF